MFIFAVQHLWRDHVGLLPQAEWMPKHTATSVFEGLTMSCFQAERDLRFDFYYSIDILEALIKVEQSDARDTGHIDNERARFFFREGFEMAIRELAGEFGYSYSPATSSQETP